MVAPESKVPVFATMRPKKRRRRKMTTGNFESRVERKCQAIYTGEELWSPGTQGTALWLRDGLGWAFEPADMGGEPVMVSAEEISLEPDL
jgi:hypothetical protein